MPVRYELEDRSGLSTQRFSAASCASAAGMTIGARVSGTWMMVGGRSVVIGCISNVAALVPARSV
jgi:hypothetical protein